MGCFSLLKSKKEKPQQVSVKAATPGETLPSRSNHECPRHQSLQSAPPSFKLRHQSRARPLSAPCSLDTEDGGQFLSPEQRFLDSKPLPLPSPPEHYSALKSAGSFKLEISNPVFPSSGHLPLPPLMGVRSLSWEEIAAARKSFSVDQRSSDGLSSASYIASFGDGQKINASVFRLFSTSTPGLQEFMAEVKLIAALQHPNLCKLLGFHAKEGSEQRILVYERLCKGSLENFLCAKSQNPAMDWATRIRVALCAARGLVFLHEEGPFRAMFSDFSTRNIQIDSDYTAKLTGYGCVSPRLDLDISNNPTAAARLPKEARETSILTPKSNVWSFGLVLLDLLTGRKNQEQSVPMDEGNLAKWSRPYLADDSPLSLIVDPGLKGCYPPAAARAVAELAMQCLGRDPSERPTMRAVAESLERVQELKLCRRFPLREPGKETRELKKFYSYNGR